MLSRYLKATHHTKRFVILDGVLCPDPSPPKDEGGGNMAWPHSHSSRTAKWTWALRLALWHFRIICGASKTCWGKRRILSDLDYLWERGWRESTVGQCESTLGCTIAFPLSSVSLYLSPYVADSPQPKWNELSEPFTWKSRRGIRGNDMIWTTNKKNDNSY